MVNIHSMVSTIEINGRKYERWPIKTHVIMPGDTLSALIEKYVLPVMDDQLSIIKDQWLENNSDKSTIDNRQSTIDFFLAVSEKIVAIMQGRSYPISEIKTGWWAKFLVKFVHKTPFGIGLGRPETMQLAISEAGLLRILFAGFMSAITKPIGLKGIFYRVAGHNVNAIDGPTPYTLPPYNTYAKLPPLNPAKVAQEIFEKFNLPCAIIDANDLGVNVLGWSEKINPKLVAQIFRDNPLGQTNEQTPLCLVW